MTRCLGTKSFDLADERGDGPHPDSFCSVSGRFKSVGKGKTGDKTWNVTHTEVIIGSTDRWCGRNQFHLGNVGWYPDGGIAATRPWCASFGDDFRRRSCLNDCRWRFVLVAACAGCAFRFGKFNAGETHRDQVAERQDNSDSKPGSQSIPWNSTNRRRQASMIGFSTSLRPKRSTQMGIVVLLLTQTEDRKRNSRSLQPHQVIRFRHASEIPAKQACKHNHAIDRAVCDRNHCRGQSRL